MRQVCSALAVAVALAAVPPARSDGDKLNAVQVARLGKSATALVECQLRLGKAHGSAFCIHPSGLFVTNMHVVAGATSVRLVLNPSLKAQKVVKASVVRLDKDNDLALLRVEGLKGLPFLKLGNSENTEELMDVVACGFPFGRALTVNKDGYPAVSINKGTVTSLRRKDGKLHRIQVDVTLNPGNSGGALLDLKGEVVGVVVSGVRGTAVNFVIPCSILGSFLDKPALALTLPTVKASNGHAEHEFSASAVALLPSAKKDFDLELVLSAGPGRERRFPMKLKDGVYRVKAVPIPAEKTEPRLRVEVKYKDGSVSGTVKDQAFRLGEKKVRLSHLRSLRLGAKPEARLRWDERLTGKLADLMKVQVRVGKQSLELDLDDAVEIIVQPFEEVTSLSCLVVARQGGKEVGRHSAPLYVEGLSRPTLETLAEGKFVKPTRAGAPVTYLRAVSSKGDYIGQGKSYSYEANDITSRVIRRGVMVSVGGWTVQFGGPGNEDLAVGEYDNAKRFPFSGDSPGIEFYGNGRGCNRIAGKFVVWELEVKNRQIVRLAIDFIQRCEERGPPLYGSLRINSTFQ